MTVSRKVSFCAGHRIWGHEGPCAGLHGHNYVAIFYATAEKLDSLGRLVDFSILKERLGGWVQEHWDHGFICHRDDRECLAALRAIPKQKTFLLDANPTAENMAGYLLKVVSPEQLAGTGVHVVRVELWETPNCKADVTL